MGLNRAPRDALLDLAAERATHTAGAMLNGIVHNMNNPCHALTMQAELLQNFVRKNAQGLESEALLEKCARMERIGQELKSGLDILSWRDTYTRTQVELLDPTHFAHWLVQFWRNDLFFKHGIAPTVVVDPPPPHLRIIPLGLLWPLEEALQAMIRACQAQSRQDCAMRLELAPLSGSGLLVRLELSVPPEDDPALALEMPHHGDVREMAEALGWQWQCTLEEYSLRLGLEIPAG
jgi:hypothetical protein